MEHAIVAAVRSELAEAHDDLRAVVDGLSIVALDWKPTPDANSIAALIAHTLDAERFLLRTALDRTFARDREAHFRTAGVDAATLTTTIDEVAAEVESLLDDVGAAALARTVVRAKTRTGAGWLLHAPAHSREHVGQAQLTRELWVAAARDA